MRAVFPFVRQTNPRGLRVHAYDQPIAARVTHPLCSTRTALGASWDNNPVSGMRPAEAGEVDCKRCARILQDHAAWLRARANEFERATKTTT